LPDESGSRMCSSWKLKPATMIFALLVLKSWVKFPCAPAALQTHLIPILETLLDLLDLYTHHRTSTIIGQDHALEKFISIRIALNQEASANALPRHTQTRKKAAAVNGIKLTNGTKDAKSRKAVKSPTGSGDAGTSDLTVPATNGASLSKPGLKDGTVRFMLDPQRAKEEKETVSEFFNLEEEEYEIEVPVERPSDRDRRRP